MRVIAHISDLHFGKIDRLLEQALMDDLYALRPSLVAISGDLTQRALPHQFKRAQMYLDQLPAPFIVVPGNHDIPLFDVTRRFLLPLMRYKHYITRHLSPLYVDQEISVFGLNSARSFTLENGKISAKQLKKMEEVFATLPKDTLKIIVTHHPFLRPPGAGTHRRLVVGAEKALQAFQRCGVDLLLTGHFHRTHISDVRMVYPQITHPMIHVQAGTAISTRIREQRNSYNILTLDGGKLSIRSREWNGEAFEDTKLHAAFVKKAGIWKEKTR